MNANSFVIEMTLMQTIEVTVIMRIAESMDQGQDQSERLVMTTEERHLSVKVTSLSI